MYCYVDSLIIISILHYIYIVIGSSVGHRSLQRYYRQKLKPTRVITPHAVSKVIAQYKALGWTGTTGKYQVWCISPCDLSIVYTR